MLNSSSRSILGHSDDLWANPTISVLREPFEAPRAGHYATGSGRTDVFHSCASARMMQKNGV